jgi:hypothetical protein
MLWIMTKYHIHIELKRIPKINIRIFGTTILFVFEYSSMVYKCSIFIIKHFLSVVYKFLGVPACTFQYINIFNIVIDIKLSWVLSKYLNLRLKFNQNKIKRLKHLVVSNVKAFNRSTLSQPSCYTYMLKISKFVKATLY